MISRDFHVINYRPGVGLNMPLNQGRREAERAPGQYFGTGPVCLKVRRGGGTHGLVG